jgi:hypothetical protein
MRPEKQGNTPRPLVILSVRSSVHQPCPHGCPPTRTPSSSLLPDSRLASARGRRQPTATRRGGAPQRASHWWCIAARLYTHTPASAQQQHTRSCRRSPPWRLSPLHHRRRPSRPPAQARSCCWSCRPTSLCGRSSRPACPGTTGLPCARRAGVWARVRVARGARWPRRSANTNPTPVCCRCRTCRRLVNAATSTAVLDVRAGPATLAACRQVRYETACPQVRTPTS